MKVIQLGKEDLEDLGIKSVDDLRRFEEATNKVRLREGKTRVKVETDYQLAPSLAAQAYLKQKEKEYKGLS